jgi:hypothetical protein
VSRSRLNVFLEPDHAKRLDELATMKRMSKSGIVAAALASYLSPEGADRREVLTARRLDKLSHQFDRLERDQAILIETVALFVRHQLAVTVPIPEAHQDAARAQGRARFEQFIEQLARHLQRGHSLVRDVFQEIAPSEAAGEGARSNGAGQPRASTS